ncbi:hypothetical protein NQ315_009873 [Exocentrus adspersus]|uniref:Uncharacterized protein n=1 Tax=Exocentrus adspersus TaxID=1586481 RepID=A0AAV8WHM1_9CUCU|nr:hypothetical protein NQ315_009873 [Exocentrus adspersus]
MNKLPRMYPPASGTGGILRTERQSDQILSAGVHQQAVLPHRSHRETEKPAPPRDRASGSVRPSAKPIQREVDVAELRTYPVLDGKRSLGVQACCTVTWSRWIPTCAPHKFYDSLEKQTGSKREAKTRNQRRIS